MPRLIMNKQGVPTYIPDPPPTAGDVDPETVAKLHSAGEIAREQQGSAADIAAKDAAARQAIAVTQAEAHKSAAQMAADAHRAAAESAARAAIEAARLRGGGMAKGGPVKDPRATRRNYAKGGPVIR